MIGIFTAKLKKQWYQIFISDLMYWCFLSYAFFKIGKELKERVSISW